MSSVIPPEGVTDKKLESFLSSLRRDAKEDVRHLLASGAGEADIAEYIASLGPEPEDEIAPPEREAPFGHTGLSSGPPRQRQEPALQKRRAGSVRRGRAQPSTAPDRIPNRPGGKLAEESYDGPPGVQGANFGYWQAGGVTRSGAKRSKRP